MPRRRRDYFSKTQTFNRLSVPQISQSHTPTEKFSAPAVVVATGGLSIPKIGATSFGYDLAKQFGLAVIPPRPALVPLTFRAEDLPRFSDLAGVSAEVTVASGPPALPRENAFHPPRTERPRNPPDFFLLEKIPKKS